jgi:KDO2-lipid IV(A) lauroyltransferase
MKITGACLRPRLELSRFLQWRFTTFLIRWLPLRIGRAYIRFLGKIYFFLNKEEKAEIKRNLASVIARLPAIRPVDLVTRQTFQGIFCHYHEKLLSAYFPYEKVRCFIEKNVAVDNQSLLDQALARGRGLILVTAHFGAVEFLPTILALNGYKVAIVARFKTERLKRTLKQRASRLGITLLDAGQSEGVIFSACRALRENQILITECDEFEAWRPHRVQRTTFLGCSAPLDRTLDLIQRRYDSPVIMGLVCRSPHGRYGLKLHSMNGMYGNPKLTSLAERALEILQWYICTAPNQWYQWKNVRIALGRELFQAKEILYETETDRAFSIPDSALHAS